MTIVSDILDLLTDTAIWQPRTARDEYGMPTYGDSTEFRARLVRKNRLVRDASGHEVVSTAQLWLGGSPAIAPDDWVTLSDGSTPVIASVERYQDEVGPCHTVVFFL